MKRRYFRLVHLYPTEIEQEARKALAGYPELNDTHIEFKWGKIARQSFMLAQPIIPTLLKHRSKRGYQIIMKRHFFMDNPKFPNGRVLSNVIVGWLAHELGHVLDYKDRSSINLMWFGVMYYFSHDFLRKADISADKNAVERGFIDSIVESKRFDRNPKYFPQSYINKLNTLYPSVFQVMEWAEQ